MIKAVRLGLFGLWPRKSSGPNTESHISSAKRSVVRYSARLSARRPRVLRRTNSESIGSKISSYKSERKKLVATVSRILESDPEDVSLDMLQEAYVKRLDVLTFERYSYAKAAKILEDLRAEYMSRVDQYLGRKHNPHFKERLEHLAKLYTAEIEKLERSLAQRPECVAETTLLKETEEDRILKWDQLQAVENSEALARLRKLLRYSSSDASSIFTEMEECSSSKLISLGIPRALIERIPVLRFCVMTPEEIAKHHPHDFVNRFEFKNLPQGLSLELVELRAIYHASEGLEEDRGEENELRKAWRVRLRSHIQSLLSLKDAGELNPNENEALNPQRSDQDGFEVLSLEHLLQLRVDEEDFRRLKLTLSPREQQRLSEMEKRIVEALRTADVEEKERKLRQKMDRVIGDSKEKQLMRDELQAMIDVLPEIHQKRFVSKISLLSKEEPLYECLLQTMLGWDDEEGTS